MASEILEHPMAKGRQTVEPQARQVAPPVLEGEVQEAEPEQPSPVLERLHALVRKGYRPEIGSDTATDVVVLRHVGRAPDLVLHTDGTVEGHDGRRPLYKRHVDAPPAFGADLREQLRFMRFVDSIPRATLRDRTRRFRQRYIYFPLVVAVLLAIHLAFTALILDGEPDQMPPPPTQVEQEAQVSAIQAEALARAQAADARGAREAGVAAPAADRKPQ